MNQDFCFKHSKVHCVPCRKEFDRKFDWGIFVFRADARYERDQAIRTFSTRGRAEAACKKLNAKEPEFVNRGGGYVVRSVPKRPEKKPEDALRVSVADGKYTVVQDADGRLNVLRFGETWRDCTGDQLVLTLAQEVDRLRRAGGDR